MPFHVSLFAIRLIFPTAIMACCLSGMTQEADETRIDRVVNGLRPYCWAFFGDEPKLDILSRMKHYRVPGVSIAVIDHGEIAWARAFGIKDTESEAPVETTTMFQAGSISKPFNAFVIMRMVEQGEFALNQDINTCLKSWQLPPSPHTASRPITISDLLNHTGGTTNFNDRTGYWGYRKTDAIPEILQILRGEPPALTPPVTVERPPGSVHYSNGGSTILQLLVMETAGKPYEQIMRETIFDPLGMEHSTFQMPLPPELEQEAAAAHDHMKPLEGKYYSYPELAAGGLWSTPSDLALFIIEHWRSLHGESNKIITQASAQRMITQRIPGSNVTEGFFITPKGREIYYGHRGGCFGFYSDMIIHKGSGNGAVVMVNGGGDALTSNLRREILIAIASEYNWPGFLPPQMNVLARPPTSTGRITGRFFVDEDNVIEIQEKRGLFFVQSPDPPIRGRVELFPISEYELVARSILPLRFRLIPGPSAEADSLVLVEGDRETRIARASADQRIPFEHLLAGDIDQGISEYKAERLRRPECALFSESRMNRLGYWLLGQKKTEAAIALFRLNTQWYPQSANTYDSLGEAQARADQWKDAIASYQRALELNPNSQSAREALRRLTEKTGKTATPTKM